MNLTKLTFLLLVFCLHSNVVRTASCDESKAREYCNKLGAGQGQSACYDELERLLRDAPSKEPASLQIQDWVVRSQASTKGKESNVFLFSSSKDSVSIGPDSNNPNLVIRCLEDKTNIFVDFDQDLRAAGIQKSSVKVAMSIDGKDSSPKSWTVSKDKRAIFPAESYIGFIKTLIGKNSLSITLTPDSGAPIKTSFNLEGLDLALTPPRSSCHWPSSKTSTGGGTY